MDVETDPIEIEKDAPDDRRLLAVVGAVAYRVSLSAPRSKTR
jgi:hypothetical protein